MIDCAQAEGLIHAGNIPPALRNVMREAVTRGISASAEVEEAEAPQAAAQAAQEEVEEAEAPPAPQQAGGGATQAAAATAQVPASVQHRESNPAATLLTVEQLQEMRKIDCCGICLDDLANCVEAPGDMLRVLKCGHVFHAHCIAKHRRTEFDGLNDGIPMFPYPTGNRDGQDLMTAGKAKKFKCPICDKVEPKTGETPEHISPAKPPGPAEAEAGLPEGGDADGTMVGLMGDAGGADVSAAEPEPDM